MCDVFLLCFSSSHPAVSLASDEEDGGDPSSSPSPPFTPPQPYLLFLAPLPLHKVLHSH